MSDLIVFVYPTESKAEEVRQTLLGLQKEYVIKLGDAVIATNTTIARDAVARLPHGNEAGGLSGAPLTQKSTAVIRELATALAGSLPIIGVGGIMNGADAAEKIAAGAALVQMYTGFIYGGPALIGDAVRAIAALR